MREQFASMGVNAREFFWTLGQYDVVLTFDAPDDELLWRDLVDGRYSKTLVVFDEVWRFFAQSKGFLEEMYRTLRK